MYVRVAKCECFQTCARLLSGPHHACCARDAASRHWQSRSVTVVSHLLLQPSRLASSNRGLAVVLKPGHLKLALLERPVITVCAAQPVPEMGERAAVVATVPAPVVEVVPASPATASRAHVKDVLCTRTQWRRNPTGCAARCVACGSEASPVGTTLPPEQAEGRPGEVIPAVCVQRLALTDDEPQPQRCEMHTTH